MNTSYFAKYRGEHGVSIALKTPEGFKGRLYKALAPPYWLLKKVKADGDTEYYTEQYYKEVLNKLDPRQVYEDLGADAVLLCWEGSEKFCHRHIIAEWLEKSLGIEVKELESMGSLEMLKKKVQEQRLKKEPGILPTNPALGARKRTPVMLKSTENTDTPPAPEKELKTEINASPMKKGRWNNQTITSEVVLPEKGYHCIGKNELPKLMKLKDEIIKAGICAFDYETDGDPDDDTQDPQDHKLTMVSFAYKIGQAFCMPLAMDAYAANWDIPWFIENFLKPILEHPDVIIIIQNCKFEHQQSLLHGIDMFPKAIAGKIMDTMIMIKALALPENTVQMGDSWEVQVGLKPATKALLADENGMVHGLMHVDDIKSFEDTVGKIEWEEPIPGEFYKSGAKKGLPKTKTCSRSRTFNELPVDQEIIDYSCSDSDWALGLYYKLLPLCHSEGKYDVITELDVPRMMVLGEYELAGWSINPGRLEAMREMADKAMEIINPQLYEGLLEVTEGYADTNDEGEVVVPAGIYGMGDWRGEPISLEIKTDKPFSWGSIQHLQWLFFHVLKVSTNGLERSKTTGLPSTGKENMDTILERYNSKGGNKFMDVLKEKRKYDKIKSTYVDGMLPYCRQDTHKLHTQLNLVSTWRLSSKKPNL